MKVPSIAAFIESNTTGSGADFLVRAVSLDDRFAAQALADPAFRGWDRLAAAAAQGLAKIRRGALR